ncbi:MAG: phytoene desaturase family protein [Candidatus Margulisbacteria bacterium]|nr:phytoene desaturase family protein [Candidatus Margulisiibacteriota bacterium]
MSEKVIIVGGGIGGLAMSCLLAKKGYEVALYEKEERLGGKCNLLQDKGYSFDMGPSRYWMPEVFEHFFKLLGENIEDHLHLVKLEPSFRVFFDSDKKCHKDIFTNREKLKEVFEHFEVGSFAKLEEYLENAKEKYGIAMEEFMYRNYDSLLDFLNFNMLKNISKFSLFASMDSYVRKFFKNRDLRKLLEYQLIFLGGSPHNTPALYQIMSHVDFNQGVYYPMGGMYKLVEALERIGRGLGVNYYLGASVEEIIIENGYAQGVRLDNGHFIRADEVVCNADMAFVETTLIKKKYQTYPKKYWEKKIIGPSGLILYLGVDGEIPELIHHNFYFAFDWEKNFEQMLKRPIWPMDPSFYVFNSTKIDEEMAPVGKENLVVFVPIASGMIYSKGQVKAYAETIINTIEDKMGVKNLSKRIEFQKIFSIEEFKKKYNSYKGTALGLSHTLFQTAVLRPRNVSKKVKNLYYVGANTNPGIGLPMCVISAELAYKRMRGIKANGKLKAL